MNEPGQAESPLAQQLVQYRLAAGWTQEDLAAESGLSHRTISDMERGVARRPQHRTLRALAAALHLTDIDLRRFLAAGGERVVPAQRSPTETTAITGSTAVTGASRAAGATDGSPENIPVIQTPPNTLPPESAGLTGRTGELAALSELIHRDRPTEQRARIVCVHGAPGIGKTSFALHCAHRLASSYVDGALFADLRGTDTEPSSVEQVLGQLLMTLGVSRSMLPCGTEQRSGMLRTLLAEANVLLLLDNVADEAQLRPLLPASPGSLVLVTSRSVLAGLTEAEHVFLDVLDRSSAVRLLGDIVGRERVSAEPEATARVATLCGGLPLALRIAGNRLATRPRWAIANLVEQLHEERRRLSALTAGDLQVRSAFAMSYRQCPEPQRNMFRRLPVIPGGDVSVELAAVVSETEPEEAAMLLERLVDTSLLQPGSAPDRYLLHDLLAVFAAERLRMEEPGDTAGRIIDLMYSWVLAEGARQGRLLFPPHNEVAHPCWLDAERARWLPAVYHGEPTAVVKFCLAMQWYCLSRPDRGLWPGVFAAGVAAARTLDRPTDLAMLLNLRVQADAAAGASREEVLRAHGEARRLATESGDMVADAWAVFYRARLELLYYRPEDAADFARHAHALFVEAGDPRGQTASISALGVALYDLGRFDEAVLAQRQALRVFGDSELDVGMARLRLAEALEAVGEFAAAQVEYCRVGKPFPVVLGRAAAGLGRCAAALGDPRAARTHLEQALGIFAAAHDLWWKARTLVSLADLEDGYSPERARHLREHALRLCADLSSPDAVELARALTVRLAGEPAIGSTVDDLSSGDRLDAG